MATRSGVRSGSLWCAPATHEPGHDITNISGATLSCRHVTEGVVPTGGILTSTVSDPPPPSDWFSVLGCHRSTGASRCWGTYVEIAASGPEGTVSWQIIGL